MRALPRLYAILDLDQAARHGLPPLDVLDVWLETGIRLIQLRAKALTSGALLDLADVMNARAQAAGATFIVNDRADVAALCGAGGVHVGQDDLAPSDVRRLVGPAAMVGVSTHTAAQVAEALSEPIDYLAVGPVFPTTTKERPDPTVGLSGVSAAARLAAGRALPVVAIGGIRADRALEVIEAGATAVAVVADLFGPDLAARARGFLERLESR